MKKEALGTCEELRLWWTSWFPKHQLTAASWPTLCQLPIDEGFNFHLIQLVPTFKVSFLPDLVWTNTTFSSVIFKCPGLIDPRTCRVLDVENQEVEVDSFVWFTSALMPGYSRKSPIIYQMPGLKSVTHTDHGFLLSLLNKMGREQTLNTKSRFFTWGLWHVPKFLALNLLSNQNKSYVI